MTAGTANPGPLAGNDQPAEEKLLWEGCPKWQADFNQLFLASMTGLLGLVLMIFLLVKFPNWWLWVKFGLPFAIFLFGAGWFAWIRVKRRNQRYKITNLNLEYESGVFSKTIHNLEMWRIRDIIFTQSLNERMLGVSRIEIISSDASTPVIILEGLPPGRRIFDDIKQAFLLAKQRRNIIGFVD